MSIYAVFLNDPDDEAWARVNEHWNGRQYILSDHLAFVAPEETTLTEEIANTIGINKDGGVVGIVIESSGHFGFNNPGLWEWMRKFS